MPLKEIKLVEEAKVHIYAYQHSEKRCDSWTFLDNLRDKKDLEKFLTALTMLSQDGLNALANKIFHEAGCFVYNFTMYGLRVKSYRLYMGVNRENSMIILTHGVVKKDQKTSRQDIKQYERCIKAVKRGNENG